MVVLKLGLIVCIELAGGGFGSWRFMVSCRSFFVSVGVFVFISFRSVCLFCVNLGIGFERDGMVLYSLEELI